MRVDHPAFVRAGNIGLATRRWRHGSGGPQIIAAHATGFCKEVWGPVFVELGALLPGFEATAFDQRSHGDSDAVVPPYDWWDLGHDVLAVADGAIGITGVGHSGGAAALVLAELTAPGTFASLVLVEPIVFPGPRRRRPEVAVAVAARRRRRRFSSRQEAEESWRAKPAFSGWDERVLAAYVTHGLGEADGGVELKCAPEHEAEFFAAGLDHGAYDRLGELAVPVLLVAGEGGAGHDPLPPNGGPGRNRDAGGRRRRGGVGIRPSVTSRRC